MRRLRPVGSRFGQRAGTRLHRAPGAADQGMRIGLMRSVYQDNCDPKILGPFDAALGEFEKLGAKIVDVPSITLTQMQAIEWPALFAETAAIDVDNVRNHGAEYNPHAKLFVAYGLLISSACYLMAQRARAQVRDALLACLARDVEVLMLPTVGFPVSPVLDDSPGLSIVAEDFSVYTAIFNFTGPPAIGVPCGFDTDGCRSACRSRVARTTRRRSARSRTPTNRRRPGTSAIRAFERAYCASRTARRDPSASCARCIECLFSLLQSQSAQPQVDRKHYPPDGGFGCTGFPSHSRWT